MLSKLIATMKSKPVGCPRCGRILAEEVDLVSGYSCLRVGELLVSRLEGNCQACGSGFYFSTDAQVVRRLVFAVVERIEQ